MAVSTTSIALSPLLVKLNVTGLQKRDQPLYDFLSHLLVTTGQIAAVAGVVSSSGGGGGSTTNITNNILQQQLNFGDTGTGEDGSPGPPGPQGNPGSSGSSGSTGPVGPAVYLTDINAPDEVFPIPGIQGPIGNIGLTGNDGPAIFLTALDGIDGDPSSIPGPQGPQGNTGATGVSGNDGPGIFLVHENYPDDPMPIPGPQGPTGNAGSTGNTGAPGQLQAVFLDDWDQPDIPIQTPFVSPSAIEIDFVSTTASLTVSSTTEATAQAFVTGNAKTYDGVTTVMVEFFACNARTASAVNSSLTCWLYDGASSIGQISFQSVVAATGNNVPVFAVRRLTPSAASHTYSIRASVNNTTGLIGAGAGGSGNTSPGYIRIYKVT
jgi:hypothetical protein